MLKPSYPKDNRELPYISACNFTHQVTLGLASVLNSHFYHDCCLLLKKLWLLYNRGFPGSSNRKESACNSGDIGSIPGWGRSPGGSNGNPLQYSCLGNPMDRRASLATIHGVARVQTQLSDYRQQKETLEGKVQRPHSPGPCHQHTSVKPSICLHIQSRLPASTLPT